MTEIPDDELRAWLAKQSESLQVVVAYLGGIENTAVRGPLVLQLRRHRDFWTYVDRCARELRQREDQDREEAEARRQEWLAHMNG